MPAGAPPQQTRPPRLLHMIPAAAGAALHQARRWKPLIVSRAALQQARLQMQMTMTMAAYCRCAASPADLKQPRPVLRGAARRLPWKSHHCAPHSSLQLRLLWLHALGRVLCLCPIAHVLENCRRASPRRRSLASAWEPCVLERRAPQENPRPIKKLEAERQCTLGNT